jgi:hypothetical protein
MARLWQFYYENAEGHHISVGIIRCKKPHRTKKYKRNLERLARENVRLVGYREINEKS